MKKKESGKSTYGIYRLMNNYTIGSIYFPDGSTKRCQYIKRKYIRNIYIVLIKASKREGRNVRAVSARNEQERLNHHNY